METKQYSYSKAFILLFLLLFMACRKFVEIPPPSNQVIGQQAFADDKTAIATLNGIYSKMASSQTYICASGASLYPAMSADELTYFTVSSRDNFFKNTLDPIGNNVELATYLWTPAYNYIYAANSCLEGAAQSENLSSEARNMVMGEAYLVRGFMYFNLVNLFGAVPAVTVTDYEVNKVMARSSEQEIYSLVVSDLQKAVTLLQDAYPSSDRTRPNRATAKCLLAKVFLYQKKWAEASKFCDEIILDSRYRLEDDLNKVFLTTSQEAIWQLAPVIKQVNSYIGDLILPVSSSAAPTFLIAPSLLNDFEVGDKRKEAWVQSRVYRNAILYYPYKYKVKKNTNVTEYTMIFRLAEVFLMRAECRAELGDFEGAKSDLNKIRQRSSLNNLMGDLDQEEILKALWQERRIELFTEWGNRWFDLKRSGLADAILGKEKPDTWKSTAVLYPIPNSQIIANPKLEQNNGY